MSSRVVSHATARWHSPHSRAGNGRLATVGRACASRLMVNQSSTSTAIPWLWQSCAPASIRSTVARCAWPATAGTAARRSTALRSRARASRRHDRGCASLDIRPSGRRRYGWILRSIRSRLPNFADTTMRRLHADLVVIGAGESGTAEAATARAEDREVTVLAGELGHDVVGVYPGPVVVARLADGQMLHVHAHDVVIATGSAELHPVCEGNMLRGIYTPAAAEQLRVGGRRPRRRRHRRARPIDMASTAPTAVSPAFAPPTDRRRRATR